MVCGRNLNGTIISDKFCMTRWIGRPWQRRGSMVLRHGSSHSRLSAPATPTPAVGGAMARQWEMHRSTITQPDAQQRWDTVYQVLLQWTTDQVRRLPTTSQPHPRRGMVWRSPCLCGSRPSATNRPSRLTNTAPTCAPTARRSPPGSLLRNIASVTTATVAPNSTAPAATGGETMRCAPHLSRSS